MTDFRWYAIMTVILIIAGDTGGSAWASLLFYLLALGASAMVFVNIWRDK